MHLIKRYSEAEWKIEAERRRVKNEKRTKMKPFEKKTVLRKNRSAENVPGSN